ncbi:hypothetical protein [Sphingomonas sp. 3-13AW]|uniref:hypothetical protein n=1 Tax=Sphingomonas sp. 3-13AW TaxID=3050450 RepID=UPI003BB77EB7
MSKIVETSSRLSLETLAAAHSVADAMLTTDHPTIPGLRRWMLGDDYVALKALSDDLGLYVAALRLDQTRDDVHQLATASLRGLSRRYSADASHGAVEKGSIPDLALRNPDAYDHQQGDTALAA